MINPLVAEAFKRFLESQSMPPAPVAGAQGGESVSTSTVGMPGPQAQPTPMKGQEQDPNALAQPGYTSTPSPTPPQGSIYDNLPGHLLYIKDAIAPLQKGKQIVDYYFSDENVGKTTGEIDDADRRKNAASMAIEAAAKSVSSGMGDDDFDSYLNTLLEKMGQRPKMPAEAELQNPSRESAIVSAIGSTLFPQQALKLGALPYEHELGERDKATKKGLQNFAIENDQYQQDLRTLQQVIGETNQRDTERGRLRDNAEDRASRERITELDRQSRERIAAGKADSQGVRDAKKVLNDPKSTRVSRAQALADLDAAEYEVPPDRKKEYLDSTYYEDNIAVDNTRADKLADSRITRDKKLNQKIDSDLRMAVKEGRLKDLNAEMLRMRIASYPEEHQAKMFNVYRGMELREEAVAQGWDRLDIQRDANHQREAKDLNDLYEKGLATTLNLIKTLRPQTVKLRETVASLRIQIASETNAAKKKALEVERDGFIEEYNDIVNKLNGTDSSSGLYDQAESLEAKSKALAALRAKQTPNTGLRKPGSGGGAGRPAGKSDAQLIAEANEAMKRGADPGKVKARLKQWGVIFK